MRTEELRHTILQRIAQIDDKSFLQAINSLVSNKAEETIFKLSADQKTEIERAQHEFTSGLAIDHKEVNYEITQWLKGI